MTPSKTLPGPRRKSIRTAVQWVRHPPTVLDTAPERYGDVWMIELPRFMQGAKIVLVSDPELIKPIFTADPGVLYAGEANAMIGTALLGEHSVILLDERDHMTQRKLLLPPFHGERVQRYRDVMARICEEELASWPLHEPVALLPRMQAITLHGIMSAVFGVTDQDTQEALRLRVSELLEFAASARRIALMHVISRRGGSLPRRFLRLRDSLDAVIYEVIDRTRRDPRLEERDDVLAMLLHAQHDDGSPMTDRELRDELVTLLMQGHMSTASALAWAIERLTRHPEALERLCEEAQTEKDEFLDAVIKETLRVRPPVPQVMRLVKQPYRLGEYELEPGMLIGVSIYLLHRREDLYPEPERFRPERFLEKPPGTYTWIPFGGGDRHCIGRSFATTEIKVVLGTLMRQARFAPAEESDEAVTRAGVLYNPSRGALAVLRERVPAAGAANIAA